METAAPSPHPDNPCKRCGGSGRFERAGSRPGVCFRCGGSGDENDAEAVAARVGGRPPAPETRAGALQMSRRDRLYACWLALRAGWPMARSTWGVVPATGMVVVEVPQLGATWGLPWGGEDEILAGIEAKFGEDARRRVEGGIGG